MESSFESIEPDQSIYDLPCPTMTSTFNQPIAIEIIKPRVHARWLYTDLWLVLRFVSRNLIKYTKFGEESYFLRGSFLMLYYFRNSDSPLSNCDSTFFSLQLSISEDLLCLCVWRGFCLCGCVCVWFYYIYTHTS